MVARSLRAPRPPHTRACAHTNWHRHVQLYAVHNSEDGLAPRGTLGGQLQHRSEVLDE